MIQSPAVQIKDNRRRQVIHTQITMDNGSLEDRHNQARGAKLQEVALIPSPNGGRFKTKTVMPHATTTDQDCFKQVLTNAVIGGGQGLYGGAVIEGEDFNGVAQSIQDQRALQQALLSRDQSFLSDMTASCNTFIRNQSFNRPPQQQPAQDQQKFLLQVQGGKKQIFQAKSPKGHKNSAVDQSTGAEVKIVVLTSHINEASLEEKPPLVQSTVAEGNASHRNSLFDHSGTIPFIQGRQLLSRNNNNDLMPIAVGTVTGPNSTLNKGGINLRLSLTRQQFQRRRSFQNWRALHNSQMNNRNATMIMAPGSSGMDQQSSKKGEPVESVLEDPGKTFIQINKLLLDQEQPLVRKHKEMKKSHRMGSTNHQLRNSLFQHSIIGMPPEMKNQSIGTQSPHMGMSARGEAEDLRKQQRRMIQLTRRNSGAHMDNLSSTIKDEDDTKSMSARRDSKVGYQVGSSIIADEEHDMGGSDVPLNLMIPTDSQLKDKSSSSYFEVIHGDLHSRTKSLGDGYSSLQFAPGTGGPGFMIFKEASSKFGDHSASPSREEKIMIPEPLKIHGGAAKERPFLSDVLDSLGQQLEQGTTVRTAVVRDEKKERNRRKQRAFQLELQKKISHIKGLSLYTHALPGGLKQEAEGSILRRDNPFSRNKMPKANQTTFMSHNLHLRLSQQNKSGSPDSQVVNSEMSPRHLLQKHQSRNLILNYKYHSQSPIRGNGGGGGSSQEKTGSPTTSHHHHQMVQKKLQELEVFQQSYLQDEKQDQKLRRKFKVFEHQYQKDASLVQAKFTMLVNRGRNAEGVGTAQTGGVMGGTSFRRKELIKLSRNVLFDSESLEDLKNFSNTASDVAAVKRSIPPQEFDLPFVNPLPSHSAVIGYTQNNKYKQLDRRRRLQLILSGADKRQQINLKRVSPRHQEDVEDQAMKEDLLRKIGDAGLPRGLLDLGGGGSQDFAAVGGEHQQQRNWVRNHSFDRINSLPPATYKASLLGSNNTYNQKRAMLKPMEDRAAAGRGGPRYKQQGAKNAEYL